MDDLNFILLGVATLATAFGLGPVILKKVRTPTEEVQDSKTTAERDSIAVSTAKELISLSRQDVLSARTEVAVLAEKVTALITRIDTLEERERHQLVRAAVHEAWDDMAFRRLYALDPTISPPPPLLGRTDPPPLNPDAQYHITEVSTEELSEHD